MQRRKCAALATIEGTERVVNCVERGSCIMSSIPIEKVGEEEIEKREAEVEKERKESYLSN